MEHGLLAEAGDDHVGGVEGKLRRRSYAPLANLEIKARDLH
jgi:hypothetical protein